jgi:hypothetical protein
VNVQRLKEILKFTWPEIEKRDLSSELLLMARSVPEYMLPLRVKNTAWDQDLKEALFVEFCRHQTKEQDFGHWSFLNPTFQVFNFEHSAKILKKHGVQALWKFKNQLFEEPFSVAQALAMDLLKDTEFHSWKEMISRLPSGEQKIISEFQRKGIISLS